MKRLQQIANNHREIESIMVINAVPTCRVMIKILFCRLENLNKSQVSKQNPF